MYGQMTAGSWIYIGSQGIVQGTYETFVEMGRQHYRRRSGRALDPYRRPRRHGRCPATGGDDGGRLVPRRRVPAEPHRDAAARPATSTCRRGPRRGAGHHRRARKDAEGRFRSALLGNAAEVFPEMVRARRAARCRDRPDVGPRSGQRLPAERLDASSSGSDSARRDPEAVASAARSTRWPCMCARCSPSMRMGVPTVDYGNNIRQVAKEEGVENAFDFPGFVPAYIRPALLPRHRAVPLGCALRRSRRTSTAPTPKVKELLPGRPAPASLAGHGARAHPVPGAAGAHLLGRARRPPPARAGLQRDGGERRAEGADRDRPRSSRFAARWPLRTARPRRCRTAPTRCPTGRC